MSEKIDGKDRKEIHRRPSYHVLYLRGCDAGRGIDQVLLHPSAPIIYEPHMKSARGYVELAELKSGPIKKPVDCSYIWGDSPDGLNNMVPDARIDTGGKAAGRLYYRINPLGR